MLKRSLDESDSRRPSFGQPVTCLEVRIALRNCGLINPENISDYMALKGYGGLVRGLELTPAEVIDQIAISGLRERIGRGIPVAEKWRTCRDANGSEGVLICNTIEGDPESLRSRTLLENDPHSVLEGILIGAYATGASSGFIYTNADSGILMATLKSALKQMEDHGLLGNHILDSGFNFHLEIIEGEGSPAYAEEGVLIGSMENKHIMPFFRIADPLQWRLKGKPALIHDVETLAHVSAILQKGAEWYAGYGTEKSRGTKVLTLSGRLKRPGLIEIPMNVSLGQIVNEIGGGLPEGKSLKAIQIGGPTGGYLPTGSLDLPFTYEDLFDAGTVMGSGRILVIDQEQCIVDLARGSLTFARDTSCGKCLFCREGTIQMAGVLHDITEGKGKPDDIELLTELSEGLQNGSQCGWGEAAARPVFTLLRYFREELETHLKEKRCPAGVCRKMDATTEHRRG